MTRPRGRAAASSDPDAAVVDLTALVAPRTIALVVEGQPSSSADEIEAALLDGGYTGGYRRIAVRGEGGAGAGTRDAADVAADLATNLTAEIATGGPPDLALVAVSAGHVRQAIAAMRTAGVAATVVLNGPEGDLDASNDPWSISRSVPRDPTRDLLLGPNSQGVISVPNRLFAGTGSLMRNADLRSGTVSVATQSGFGHALVALGESAGLGFGHILSTGNEGGLDVVDVASWLVERDDVELVWMIAEGIRDGRRLLDLGRRAARHGTRILLWKTATSGVGQRAAASHTGAMATDARILEGTISAAGIVAAHGEDELIDASRVILARRRRPDRGRWSKNPAGIGIITVSGGAGVALADCLAESGLTVPGLRDATIERIREHLPAPRPIGNPLDVGRTVARDPNGYRSIAEIVAADPGIGWLVLCHGGIEGATATSLAAATTAIARRSRSTSVVWAPRAGRSDDAMAMLDDHQIPCFASVHRAARALAVALRAAQEVHIGAPGEGERISPSLDVAALAAGQPAEVLDELRSKRLIAAYGIPIVREVAIESRGRRLVAPTSFPLSFPVVVKADAPDIQRRGAAGLVRRDVMSAADAFRTARELATSVARRRVDLRGVLVQEQARGIEVFLGAIVDADFGPTVGLGRGGTDVEWSARPVFSPAPLSADAAAALIARSELAGRLSDRQARALGGAVVALGWLIADNVGAVAQVDINPLFVTSTGVVAADALVVRAAPDRP